MDQLNHLRNHSTLRASTSPQDPVFTWQTTARPLSDIREITEPSLLGAIHRTASLSSAKLQSPTADDRKVISSASSTFSARSNGCRDASPLTSKDVQHASSDWFKSYRHAGTAADRLDFHYRDRRFDLNAMLAPISNASVSQKQQTSSARTSHDTYRVIQNGGRSHSPVGKAPTYMGFSGDQTLQDVPSKTFIKYDSPANQNVLDFPINRHPRLSLNVHLSGPLFVGGSSIEGTVDVVVDEAVRLRHRKSLMIERLTVDLVGFEELSGSKRFIFLALGNELVDFVHPPAAEMVESQQPPIPTDQAWFLVPSSTSFPFLITLPLEIGPPPFDSKHAKIRYVVAATAFIREAGRQLCVRSSQDTIVLSVYDPEKALVSLPSPLTASDECVLRRGQGNETVSVTAGLHRQVWVSGTSMFADVQVINNSRKSIKKLELQLERIILCYHHTAASTLEMSASQARLFDQLERSIICKEIIRPGYRGWNRIPAFSTALRTCHLELPRRHATIKCHKYFEVRYYLNVIASSSHTRLVTIQLPIVLIHMNSLDVPTNAVAQVAAAIQEKKATRALPTTPNASLKRISRLQGRAFAAPRMRSLDRDRSRRDNIAALGQTLERSPRRQVWHCERTEIPDDSVADFTFKTPPSNRRGRLFLDRDISSLGLRRFRSRDRSVEPNFLDRRLAAVESLRRAPIEGRLSSEDENRSSNRTAFYRHAKPSLSTPCLGGLEGSQQITPRQG